VLRLGRRGQMLTPIKFLVFAVTFISVFAIFQIYYSGSAAAIENLKNVDTNLPAQSTKSLTIMYVETPGTVTDVDSWFNIRGERFLLTAEHIPSQANNAINVFMEFPDMATITSWTNLYAPTQGYIIPRNNYDPRSVIGAPNSKDIMIPMSQLQLAIPTWGQYNLVISIGPIENSGNTTNGSVYGSATYSVHTDYVPSNWIDGTIRTLGSLIKGGATSVFTAVLGDSGAKFIDTISAVMTVDLPGVPDVIRIPIALIFNVAMLYIIATIAGGVIGAIL
jgi:hypothetical protein